MAIAKSVGVVFGGNLQASSMFHHKIKFVGCKSAYLSNSRRFWAFYMQQETRTWYIMDNKMFNPQNSVFCIIYTIFLYDICKYIIKDKSILITVIIYIYIYTQSYLHVCKEKQIERERELIGGSIRVLWLHRFGVKTVPATCLSTGSCLPRSM